MNKESDFSSKEFINIDRILREKKINKSELAAKLKVPRQSIYSYLNGNVSLEKLVNIARVLDIEVWELFSGSGNSLTGFVEHQGTIYRIRTVADLETLLETVKRNDKGNE